MCGIVAIIGHSNIENVLHRIKHRGLDSTKILQHKNFSIGFNRLSINDKTSSGMQPFEFKDLIGAFNGEIYNADTLRKTFNIKTSSESDTEIILPLFEKSGPSIIFHLDGFFSGIIYEKTSERIFFLRDYIGKKPLFLIKSRDALIISSELKAADFIEDFQIIPKGVSELINGQISLIQKHRTCFISKESLKSAIVDAVKKRIPKHEKQFGVFLSGGLDSSIIASIVSQYSDNVVYYTLGNTDDRDFVDLLSKTFNFQDKVKKINLPEQNELPLLIDKVVYHTESYNPSIISNGLATYLLAEAAHKDGLKVVLSGEGADELFCGYPLSDDATKWFNKRSELINNMHYTELRRLDLASMANTIEIRCPFLDKQVYFAANNCLEKDLISKNQGKFILRQIFSNNLPAEIIQRKKMSFDVGSGIRKLVVEFLRKDGLTEKNALKRIWSRYFPNHLSEIAYFHSYPTFDKAIEKRGISHRNNALAKIEELLLKEFKTVPFHNLYMLNNKDVAASDSGGTCSDKVLHFKKILADNGFTSKLHSAFIKGIECHRMLTTEINGEKYFIDVGSGWPSQKLFPADKPVEYSVYGMTFKTELSDNNLLLYHKIGNNTFTLMETIPLHSMCEEKILSDIAKRFDCKKTYPFNNSLRFSKVIGESFYFIKGDKLKIYNDRRIEEKVVSEPEISKLIKDTFKFDISDMNIKVPQKNPDSVDISVIIATKNRNSLLQQRSIKSLENQTLKPDRVIVVDDSDNRQSIEQNKRTIETFKEFEPDVDIYYISNHRTPGASGAWNSAIDFLLLQNQTPENSWIAILDDDDEWDRDYLKNCATNIAAGTENNNEPDMVACDFFRITNRHKSINHAPDHLSAKDFLIGNPGIQGSNMFIRLACFLEAGGFDENLKSCTDRDLCIRISDLGDVRYKRISLPLMNHYAEDNRERLSNPNSETKLSGLTQFWLKYSKRMSLKEKEDFQERAQNLFNWQYSPKTPIPNEPIKKSSATDSFETYSLYVGIICSNYEVFHPLLKQLDALRQKCCFINHLRIFLLENNLPEEDKQRILKYSEQTSLAVTFITSEMEDEWISKGIFENFARNKNGFFSIAQSRTMLQKYIGQIMDGKTNTVAWILDEDMQLTEKTVNGLKILHKLKDKGIDILIGKYEYSSPNPPINGIRIQLVDIYNNLRWLLNQNPNDFLPDLSDENLEIIKKYPDYYYDLSRKHFGHLECPFWIKPISPQETIGNATKRLCRDAIKIFGGTPITRPLVTIQTNNILDSVKDSVNRGGNTFVFNAAALQNTPNINIRISGTDIRRSDMIWAIVNKYYRKMAVKTADIPVWHAGKEMADYSILDIDKLREEILGSILYASLTDFLKTRPSHSLKFTEDEIQYILQDIQKQFKQRMTLLKQTFYRARGISKSIITLAVDNKDLKNLTETIEKVFSRGNFMQIEQKIQLSLQTLRFFLNSIQEQADILQRRRLP